MSAVSARRFSSVMVALIWGLGRAHAEDAYILDQNGCKAWNANPTPNETIRWSGACKDGFIEGPGTLQWFGNGNLSSINQTTFVAGKSNGYAKYNDLKNKAAYEGDVVNGRSHGYGELRNVEQGWRYSGEFWEDKFHGAGEQTLANGNRMQGQWKNGERNGFFVQTDTDGTVTQGFITSSDGTFEGPGTQLFPSGHRVNTIYLGGGWQLGALCEERDAAGKIVADGTIKLVKDGKRQCKNSFGANFAEFLTGVSQQMNAYAAANGYGFTADPNNPFAMMTQIAQLQAQQRQQRQLQQQQMLQVQMMQQMAANTAPAVTSAPANASEADEIAALRAQLAQKERQLVAAQQQPSPIIRAENYAPKLQPPAPAPRNDSQPARSAPQPSKRASFTHSHEYESNGAGDLVYNVYIENDGEVPIQCDTRVNGIVWSATGGNRLQDNYTDRRTSVVYPGRRQVVAGFDRVVPNSGSYETSCVPQ